MTETLRRLAVSLLFPAAVLSAQPAAGGALPRMDPSSRVTIGSADGDERTLFSRISGAVRLSSGEIVVADQSSGEIRWFAPDGRWLRTTGRAGEGPGEFRGLRRLLHLRGDSVLAEDGLAARMTLYDRSGRLVRAWAISPAGTFVTPPPIGRLSDGSFVALTERSLNDPPGHVRHRAILIHYAEGAIKDTLAEAPGSESSYIPCGPDNSGMCNVGVAYGVRAMAAVSGDRVFIGNGERYELLAVTPGQARVDTIAHTAPPTALTADRVAYFRDSVVAGLPESRRAVARQRLAAAPARRTMPFFDQLVADDAGRLWLARPQERGAAMRAWDVWSVRGQRLGGVELPSRLWVTQIANGHVVGVVKDADGVESVEVLRLR